MIFNIFNFLKACAGFRLFCFLISIILSIIVLYQAILLCFFTVKLNAFILLLEYICLMCSWSYSIFGF